MEGEPEYEVEEVVSSQRRGRGISVILSNGKDMEMRKIHGKQEVTWKRRKMLFKISIENILRLQERWFGPYEKWVFHWRYKEKRYKELSGRNLS